MNAICLISGMTYMSGGSTQMNGNPYVKLLLHCDGLNGGTLFPDSGYNNITKSSGNAITTTSLQKFGTASLQSTSVGQLVRFDNAFVGLGLQNFSVDFWYYPTTAALTTTNGLFEMGNPIENPAIYNNGLRIITSLQNRFWISIASSSTNLNINPVDNFIVGNQWQHVAVCRYGANVYGYWDGVMMGSASFPTRSMTSSNVTIQIATSTGNSNYYGRGYIDEIRLLVGISAYDGSNFTPPSAPYANAAPTF